MEHGVQNINNYPQPQAVQQQVGQVQTAGQVQQVYAQSVPTQPTQVVQPVVAGQPVAVDPAYAEHIAAMKSAEAQRVADLQAMQARFMDKVYNDPMRQQPNAQAAVNGDTLGLSGQSQDTQPDVSMRDILAARFNETTNTVQLNFKKTCLIKAYETEVVEGSATITLNESMSGIERALAINIIEAQVEQAVNENVLAKGLVTHYEYEQKKNALVETVNKLRKQAIELIGEEQVNKIFNM